MISLNIYIYIYSYMYENIFTRNYWLWVSWSSCDHTRTERGILSLSTRQCSVQGYVWLVPMHSQQHSLSKRQHFHHVDRWRTDDEAASVWQILQMGRRYPNDVSFQWRLRRSQCPILPEQFLRLRGLLVTLGPDNQWGFFGTIHPSFLLGNTSDDGYRTRYNATIFGANMVYCCCNNDRCLLVRFDYW